ncbi:hypothetical protein HBE96_23045 [Clostridium sp. P21]|uniref:Uncharacterized protein n=1 Tax=Clostridium muellerianum TaxID=2716538 RepID=A0A7Y0EL42_9CLOT|nr:hypothetical protein [Clostridium muellerianum]NMM65458.1 hypothetical protein [Clostridium muellerianum]
MENMDIKSIKQNFVELLAQLLENKIDRNTAAKLMRKQISLGSILELQDKLLTYSHFALNVLDYEYCTTTDSELLYLLECLEGKREYSDEARWEFILNSKEPITKLTPTIKGQKLNLEDYDRYTPEKFEYYNGYVFGDKITTCKLISLLMVNVGIEAVIKLAPKAMWEEALKNYK